MLIWHDHVLMIPRHFRPLCVGVASGLLATSLAPVGAGPAASVSSQVIAYTGSSVAYIVGPDTSSLRVVVQGAAGGGKSGGVGARVQADLEVVPGDVIQISVGGAGMAGAGGWNGGGDPGDSGGAGVAQNFGGGGSSDIRTGSCAATLSCTVADAVVVAGGGGGGDAINSGHAAPVGGAGGAPDGVDGGSGHAAGGGGASGSAPGSGGVGIADETGSGGAGSAGTGGVGGRNHGEPSAAYCAGAGGGGGWFGGGGGGSDASPCSAGGAGGGGSSYSDLAVVRNATYSRALTGGDGEVTISPSSGTAPHVDDPVVTQVSGRSATFRARVDPGGAAAEARFVYSRNDDLNGQASTTVTSVEAGAGPTTVRATVMGLDPDMSYFVRADVTSAGVHVRSGSTSFSTARAPDRPNPPVAAPSPARGSARVTWVAPADGGATITGYVVHSLPGAGSCTTSSIAPLAAATSCVVSGLDPQVAYSFVVEAFNDAGSSGPSVAGSAVVPGARSLPVRVIKAPSRVLNGKRVRVRARVGQAATGRVEVSVGSMLLCAKNVVDGVAQCRGKVSGSGNRSLRVVFTGSGLDSGASGGTISRLSVHDLLIKSATARIRGCRPILRVGGMATTRRNSPVRVAYKRGPKWYLSNNAQVKKSGRWVTQSRSHFGTIRVRAKSAGITSNTTTVTIRRPKGCAR